MQDFLLTYTSVLCDEEVRPIIPLSSEYLILSSCLFPSSHLLPNLAPSHLLLDSFFQLFGTLMYSYLHIEEFRECAKDNSQVLHVVCSCSVLVMN